MLRKIVLVSSIIDSDWIPVAVAVDFDDTVTTCVMNGMKIIMNGMIMTLHPIRD